MTNSWSLCVYCGSSKGDDPKFHQAAVDLGAAAAKRGVRIVYGGGGVGLMGAVASSARDTGGNVYGVIPEFLLAKEGLLDDVEHKIVDTMHERKMLMFEESEAFAVLPGGIGTLEELIETLSWARLELHQKPIVLINLDGFWSPLMELMDHIVARGFAPAWFKDQLIVVDSVDQVLGAAEAAFASEPA